jgi:hypothetical protein
MKKNPKVRLVLHRETLCSLAASETEAVRGGYVTMACSLASCVTCVLTCVQTTGSQNC